MENKIENPTETLENKFPGKENPEKKTGEENQEQSPGNSSDKTGENGQENLLPEEKNENKKDMQKGPEERSQEKELSPREKITDVLNELNYVDQKIFESQRSIAETKEKLAGLQKDMGVTRTDNNPPSAQFDNEKIKKLEEEKAELEKQKKEWMEEYGRENLPEGTAIESKNGGREAKADSFGEKWELEKEKKQNREEELKERKRMMQEWEERAVSDFERAMKNDWRTLGAINLNITIEIMKFQVPQAMDKKSKDFLEGKTDTLPFSTVWIKWETTGLFERIFNKNKITKLDITFDDKAEELASQKDIEKKEKEEKEKENKKNGREGEKAGTPEEIAEAEWKEKEAEGTEENKNDKTTETNQPSAV